MGRNVREGMVGKGMGKEWDQYSSAPSDLELRVGPQGLTLDSSSESEYL